MTKIMMLAGATIGGWVAWFAARGFGTMTAFFVSVLGSAVGVYLGRRWASRYE